MHEESGYSESHLFGIKANSPFGELMITSNFDEIPDNPIVYVVVTPLLTMANDYSENIIVEPLNKLTSVIKISLVDPVKLRAKDFINTLIRQYNADGVDEKNQVSKNTAEFIANRLSLIRQELDVVELEVAQYKQLNELTDINAEADIFIEHSVNTKNQIIKLNIDVGMIRFMIDFLEEKNMPFKLLPTNLGLSDESISVSVVTYNSLVLDRNRL